MPRALVVPAVLAALVLLGTGCGSAADGAAPGVGLAPDETRWVARYVGWLGDLADDLAEEDAARLVALDDPGAYRSAVEPLLGCRRALREEVGDGPTARTDAVAARLRAACARIEGAVGRLADAYTSGGDPVRALVVAADGLGSANDALAEIDEAIEGFTLARRPLPCASWPEEGSRLDPELTAAAETVAEGFEARVQCWSREEWRRVMDEEEALSDGELTIDTTGAFANPTTRQIHIQEPECDTLGRASREGRWWPGGAGERQDLAWALAVLAHESQHIAGAWDEAETECRGQQRLADLAVALGAPVARARALAELSWRDQYPELDPDYVTALCRDGGPYDLRPGTAGRWPWG